MWAFFWSFWPLLADPNPASVRPLLSYILELLRCARLRRSTDKEQMNWAVLIFGAIVTIAGVAFIVHARKTYHGPVTKVRTLESEL